MVDISVLKLLGFFRPFTEEELKVLAAKMIAADFKAQETIFRENQIGDDSMYVIIDGAIKITKKTKLEEKNLASLKNGDFFGEMSMLLPAPRSASAVTVMPCRLLQLLDRDYIAFKRDNPSIAVKLNEIFLKELIQRLREADKRLVKDGHGIGAL
jgi:CRP/FNR family transcriptional regulator, cyclic AMP receptor protein